MLHGIPRYWGGGPVVCTSYRPTPATLVRQGTLHCPFPPSSRRTVYCYSYGGLLCLSVCLSLVCPSVSLSLIAVSHDDSVHECFYPRTQNPPSRSNRHEAQLVTLSHPPSPSAWPLGPLPTRLRPLQRPARDSPSRLSQAPPSPSAASRLARMRAAAFILDAVGPSIH